MKNYRPTANYLTHAASIEKIIADPVKLSDSVADLNLSKSSILKIVEYSAEKGDLEFIKSGYFTLH